MKKAHVIVPVQSKIGNFWLRTELPCRFPFGDTHVFILANIVAFAQYRAVGGK